MNKSVRLTSRKRIVAIAFFAPFAYQGIALLCLRHWRNASHWSDLDYFSGGFFVLNLLLLLWQIGFTRQVFSCRAILCEASGLNYDPSTVRWATLQSVGDLSIFLDYGHWHLTPALRVHRLQIPGLILYAIAMLCLMSTNACLARHFQRDSGERTLMTTGPFSIVRHPRYASLLLAKLGFSLLFASVLGWISLFISVLLTRRRIRLEEAHLRQVFGSGYDVYSQRTRRLLPRIY